MALLDDIAASAVGSRTPASGPPPGGFLGQIAQTAVQAQPGQREESSLLPQVLATGARVLFPLVGGAALGATTGGLAAAGGLAAGGAAGEFTAQAIESAFGQRPQGFELAPIAGEAALGAALGPISGVRRALQAGRAVSSLGRFGQRLPGAAAGALEGGFLGGAGQAISTGTREGRLPSPGELALGVGTGGVLGGALGAASTRVRPPEQVTRTVSPEETARLAGPQGRVLPQTPTRGARLLGGEDLAQPGFGEDVRRLAQEGGPRPARSVAEMLALDEQGRERITRAVPSLKVLSPNSVKTFTREALAQLKDPGKRREFLESEGFKILSRVNRQLAEAFDQGILSADETLQAWRAAGFDDDLASTIRQAASESASVLGTFSAFKRNLNSLLEPQIKVARREARTSPAWTRHLNDLLQVRRAALVTQLSTAVRNTISQTARYSIEVASDAYRGVLGDQESLDRALFGVQNVLRPGQARQRVRLIQEEIPDLLGQLQRFRATEGPQSGRIFEGLFGTKGLDRQKVINNMQWLNLHLNTGGDDFIRALRFDANFRAGLKRAGIEDAFLKNPKQALDAMGSAQRLALDEAIESGILDAQRVSFAEPPTDAFFQGMSSLVNRFPIFTIATPFPRFMGSAFNFIKQHNPSGLLRAFNPTNAQDPNALKEIFARATLGTGFLAAGLAIRGSEFAGARGTEIRIPGSDQVFDTRSLFPLTFHMALADMILKMSEGKSPGELPWPEIRESFLAVGRFSDAVPAFSQALIGRGDLKGFRKNLEKIAGDFISGFSVGGRTIKDLLEGLFDYERSVDTRSTSAARVWGPLAANVPFGGSLADLPPLISPITGRDIAENKPVNFFGVPVPAQIFRQISGVNVQTRNEVERELRSLGISPFSFAGSRGLTDPIEGAEEAATRERNIKRTLMGPLVTAYTAPLLPRIRATKDKALKEALLKGAISRASQEAGERARLLFRQRNLEGALTIEASGRTSPLSALNKRRAAQRQLISRFGRTDLEP